jgi:Peptidase family M23
MQTRVRVAALLCVFLSIFLPRAFAQNVDPKPVQVTTDFVFRPSPILQAGTQHLVYELLLTNFGSLTYTLGSVDVKAGERTFTFAGPELKPLLRLLGDKPGDAPTQTLEPGRSFVVFLFLTFDRASEIPNTLQHTIHFTSDDKSPHTVSAELEVRQHTPVIVAPPLRGADWMAEAATGPSSYHRRALMVEGGHAWLAQRYAIDFAKFHMVNGKAFTWKGPENQNASYFCYDDPIYNVAAGKVVETLDGIPENVPHSGKLAIDLTWQNAGGNHVIVDIGYGLYAFYAHMRPGSVAVKVGDVVTVGQVLGHVGNTGSSSEPHLHFHIVDRPLFLSGQGVPYEFTNFSTSPKIDIANPDAVVVTFTSYGAIKPVQNEYPPENAALVFPQ